MRDFSRQTQDLYYFFTNCFLVAFNNLGHLGVVSKIGWLTVDC